jgi:hypothetical protein
MPKKKKVFYSLIDIYREYMPRFFKEYKEKLKKEIEEMGKKFDFKRNK